MKYHIAVIGGGPAGYVAAIRASQLGAKVVLFEKNQLGGTCLNRGCIPTKAYLHTAELLRGLGELYAKGILAGEKPEFIWKRAVDYKNKAVRTLTQGVSQLLGSNGVEVVKGEAYLESARRIFCAGKSYEAEHIILCGGSAADKIPIAGMELKKVLISDEILDIEVPPQKLCIIGGGVIGCEMAAAFSAFGSQVTIVEATDRLVPMMDEEVSETIRRAFEKQGITIHTGCQVKRIEETKKGNDELLIETNGPKLCSSSVLLAVGRRPDLSCLGNMRERFALEKGRVKTNEYMETSVPGIYACGDLNGKCMLAHAAFAMGETAAENCLGSKKVCDLRFVPNCLYTMPEAAGVGMTEKEARERYGASLLVGRFPLSANGRAVSSMETEGFVKVLAEKTYGQLVGVHIAGKLASEMIAEAGALMATEAGIYDVAEQVIHGHPSYSEAFGEACLDALGRCIHLPAKRRKSAGLSEGGV